MAFTAEPARRRRPAPCAALLGALVLASCGCERSERVEAGTAAASAAPDPYADGRRLAAARAGVRDRFRNLKLPDCAPLLPDEKGREHCHASERDLKALREAVERQASPVEVAPLAGSAALSAQRASQALRAAGMRRLLDERARQPEADPGAGVPTQPASPAHDHNHAHAGATNPTPVRIQENRDLDAIGAYARVATLGLRELGTILEFGPLTQRQRALVELERLAREEPHWAGLRALVQEATLVEPDPQQKQRLTKLRQRLGP